MRSKTKCVFPRKVRVFFDTAESDTYDTLAFYESEILWVTKDKTFVFTSDEFHTLINKAILEREAADGS
jgi:hypothetical protein